MKLSRLLSLSILLAVATAVDISSDCLARTASYEAADDKTAWTCPSCGHKGNTGKFCSNCGAKKPEA